MRPAHRTLARRAWARADIEEAERLATDDRRRFLVHYVRGRHEQALAGLRGRAAS